MESRGIEFAHNWILACSGCLKASKCSFTIQAVSRPKARVSGECRYNGQSACAPHASCVKVRSVPGGHPGILAPSLLPSGGPCGCPAAGADDVQRRRLRSADASGRPGPARPGFHRPAGGPANADDGCAGRQRAAGPAGDHHAQASPHLRAHLLGTPTGGAHFPSHARGGQIHRRAAQHRGRPRLLAERLRDQT